MNLKRHHVLYGLLAMSLMAGVLILLLPRISNVSYTPQAASTTQESIIATSTITAMKFEVVTTLAQQEQGLSGRTNVPENYGMLFVFDHADQYGFWMKDMRVPIDIIWLSDTGTILKIEDSVSPSTYPNTFYAPQPVTLVLETKAGEARRRGWGVGTQIPLPRQ